jgi:hypothetical protein
MPGDLGGMTDAIIVSDRGNVFESLFSGLGRTCMQVTPGALGSPYCPPCRLLIIPSGFADPKYYKVLSAIERNADRIRAFIEAGGVVLAFGAMLEDYTYDWLPVKLSYHMKFKEADVKLVDPSDPAASLVDPGRLDCDGYFTEWDGNVVMVREEGRPVLVSKKVGKGHVIASALHQWPSENFIRWATTGESLNI